MDILLHIAGLGFIPIMIYILFLGLQDIISVWRDQYASQLKKETSKKYYYGPHHFGLIVSKTSIS